MLRALRNSQTCSRGFSGFFSRSYSSSGSGKCLVVADHNNQTLSQGTLSVITAANQLSKDISVLVLGENCKEVVQQASKVNGVQRVLYRDAEEFRHPLAETFSQALLQCQEKQNYSYILGSTSSTGKNVLPRVAAKLDVQPISDIIRILSEDTFVRPIYAGNALSTVQSIDAVKVATVRPTSFERAEVGAGNAETEELALTVKNSLSQWVREEVGKSDRPDLSSAKIVVSGGRGMKSGENFKMLEELADLLGGAVGASRAAVDDGMVPNEMQVGQTGKVVAPELYIAVGISGAFQHLAGMKDSKVIAVINKDEEAPFFQIADFGLVGDLFTAVPELITKLKEKKASA